MKRNRATAEPTAMPMIASVERPVDGEGEGNVDGDGDGAGVTIGSRSNVTIIGSELAGVSMYDFAPALVAAYSTAAVAVTIVTLVPARLTYRSSIDVPAHEASLCLNRSTFHGCSAVG